MKGQQKIFEEILLFSLGMILASSILIVFNMASKPIGSEISMDQLKNINSLVSSIVVDDYDCGENVTLKAKIPPFVGNKEYVILIKDGKVNTTLLNGKMYFSDTLYGIQMSKKVMSVHGSIEVSS